MKKIFYYISAAVLVLGVVSCAKEVTREGSIDKDADRQISFWADINDETVTKTTLSGNDAEGYKVLWSEGDEIIVKDSWDSRFTLVEGAGTTRGKFVGTSKEGDGTYKVFYATNGKDFNGTSYYNGAKVISYAPMAATITISNDEVTTTDFKNICGLLRLSLKGFGTVSQIRIYADQSLRGKFDIGPDGSAHITTAAAMNDYLTQKFEDGVQLSDAGTDFYISMVPNDYTGVKIEVSDPDGNIFTKTLKAGKTLGIARAQITPVSLTMNMVKVTATASVSNIKCKKALVSGKVTHTPGVTIPMTAEIFFSRTASTLEELKAGGRKQTVTLNDDGSFSETLTLLNSNEQYYYTVVAKVGDLETQTEVSSFRTKVPPVATAVDLGLSVKWASFDIGAEAIGEEGDYYQWGGTQDVTDTQIYLGWVNFPYHVGTDRDTSPTKYDGNPESSTYDGRTVLEPMDDAAHVKWGGKWRMPTKEECQELHDKCCISYNVGTMGDLNGWIVESNINDNTIFLPAAGYRDGYMLRAREYGNCYFWSSSLVVYEYGCYVPPMYGYCLEIIEKCTFTCDGRMFGYSIRPVCSK